MKTLLVAAGLLVGTNAWASLLSPTAGKADNSTAWNTWDEGFTQNYTMSGNGTATFTFHYTSDPTASDYAGWTFFIGKSINTTNVWDTWISCRGYDGTFYGADGLAGTRASSNTYSGTLSATSCTEADVVMTVTRTSSAITAVAAVDPTDGSDDYTITWTYTYGGSEDATKDLYLSFAVEKAYLSISNVTGAGIITTTQADIDFSNAIQDGVVSGKINSMTIGASSYSTTEIAGDEDNKYLFLGYGENTVTIPVALRAGSKDIVTIKFDLALADGADNHGAFYIKDADGANIGYMKCALWSKNVSNETNLGIAMSTTTFNKNTVNPKDALWNKRTSFTITLNYLTHKITTVSQIQGGSVLDPIVVDMTNTNPVAQFIVSATPSDGAGGATRRAKFGNLVITTTKGDYSSSDVDYTVKFVDGDGNKVKEDDTTREFPEGTAISELASSTDKAIFYNDGDIANNAADEFVGATNKYKYKSVSAVNSSSEAITELEAGAIVTIVYDKYNKYDYAVKQKIGDADATDKETGTLWGDEEFSCYFPKGVKSGDDYYFTEANASSPYFKATVTAANPTKTINYAIDPTVAFYSEGEDLASKTAEYTHFASDMANGSSGVLNGEDGNLITSLSAGIYTITARTIGRGNDDAHKIHFYKSAVDNANKLLTCSPSNSGYTETSDAFALTGATDILIKGAQGGGANGNGLDYVIINKLPDNVSVTIASSGYSSLGSAYALDFANVTTSTNGAGALTAFAATESSETSVKLVSIDEAPARTGVILKGTAGATYTIPVKANAAALTVTNLLHAAVTDTPIGANTSYIMQGGQFHLVTAASTVPAGKAYLQTTGGAKALTVAFADDVTGIANVNAAESVQPVKRIVNGQLVIEMNGKRYNAAGAEF